MFDSFKSSASNNQRNEDTRRELKMKILTNLRRLLLKKRSEIQIRFEPPSISKSVEPEQTIMEHNEERLNQTLNLTQNDNYGNNKINKLNRPKLSSAI